MADWFFDGFIVDWKVRDRIEQISGQVDEVIQRGEVILGQLERN